MRRFVAYLERLLAEPRFLSLRQSERLPLQRAVTAAVVAEKDR